MKILFVSLYLPQEKAYHAGGRYVFEMLRHLSRCHEIHLVTRLEEGEASGLEELRPLCREIYPYTYCTKAKRSLLDKLRLMLNYLGFSRYADRLIRGGDYDLVQVEWVPAALLIRRGRTPLVLDALDVMTKPAGREMLQSKGIGRLRAWVVYALIKAAEVRIARRFDAIFTMSECDRQYLLKLQPGLNVKTVPIPAGMDITEQSYPHRPDSILFLASYKYRRLNVDAALWFNREVLPLVRRQIPCARFIIAGYGPPEELTALAERDPLVEVPGFVDDMDRCYKEAAVFVAPILTGGGIIVKVLDALAAGTPVVTTTYGNEGINAVTGRDLLVADDPEAFAAAVVRLLTDREMATRLAANGRDFVREHYGLETVIDRLEKAYKAVRSEVHG